MYFYNNTELYHHGIKGQKWGVRRFQNEDGSLKPAGEKHRQALNDALFDRFKNQDTLNASRESDYDKVKKKYKFPSNANNKELREFYYDKNGRMTRNAKKYLSEIDKLDDKYREKDLKAYQKDRDAIKNNWKKADSNETLNKIKKDVKTIMKDKDSIETKIMDAARQKALSQYKVDLKSKYPDEEIYDVEYGFDHEVWREGNKQYDKAYSEYKKASKELNNKLKTQIDNYIKEGLGPERVSQLNKDQIETAKFLVQQHIRFDSYI